jgi:hypothetical protein
MRIGMEASVDILLLVVLTWSEIGDLMNRCWEVRLLVLVLVLVVPNGVSLIYLLTLLYIELSWCSCEIALGLGLPSHNSFTKGV